ncbi:methyl-accepting chemotaxis protein [Paenibacillus physcomitrellae]|uniref:Methyl-accepting chemotaxis protein n=1 Tax=Paenibacillus physcomitrellae TaxID=1619311 RepID=A0ABQ1FPP7_9BACL|nr:methyl-accepting chemotaxis protein [Paenibacillus physcomitrellae]GGA24601.1 hypothetical protein GCM10010917_06840 [Paenibacillus physcomitrellae]
MSLKIKSLSILLALLVLTSVCSFGVLVYKMHQEVYDNTVLNLREQTDQLAQGADNWMNGVLNSGQLFADQLGGAQTDEDKDFLQQTYIKENSDIKKIEIKEGSSGIPDKPAFGSIFVNETTQYPAVPLTFPIHDRNGKIIGSVREEVDLSYMQTQVAQTRIGETGLAAIVAPSGKLIAHQDISFVREGKSVPDALIQLIQTNSNNVITFTSIAGAESFGAVSPIGSTGWFAQTAAPVKELETVFYDSLLFGIIALIVSLVVGGAIAVYLYGRLFKSLPLLKKRAEKIALKDLSEEPIIVNTRDEIGALATSFNHMTDNLRNIILKLRSNSGELTAYSQQLFGIAELTSVSSGEAVTIIERIAANAEQQRQMVENSMNAIEEVGAAIVQISSTVSYSGEASEQASDAANIGFEAMQRLVERMNTIHGQIGDLSAVIERLEQRSGEIGQIVDYMTAISSQTKILALNASIESARAGEAGKGFGVVASEVRKLASDSFEAAEQITQLIASVQTETSHASAVMKETRIGVSEGIEAVSFADGSFQQLFSLVGQVNEKVLEMTDAAKQIAASNDSVVQSVRFISDNTNETVAGVTQIAATAKEQASSSEKVLAAAKYLADTSAELHDLLEEFKE